MFGNHFRYALVVRNFVVITVSLLCSCSLPCEPAESATEDNRTPDSVQRKFIGPYRNHPILDSNYSLSGKTLIASDFRKLNGAYLTVKRGPYSRYGHVELEAASQFCKLVKGCRPEEVELLAGRPSAKVGQVGCWKDSRADESNWLYYFGVTPILVRVVFNSNNCTQAIICDGDKTLSYQKWRIEKLEIACAGETLDSIIASEGTPHEQRSQPSLIGGPVKTAEIVTYSVGSAMGIELTVINGKCVSSKGYMDFE